jgi:hypothetical protein
MKRLMLTITTMWAAAALGFAQPASGDDLMPPDWRGDPRSTMQEWDFSNEADPLAPTVDANPYGTPTLVVGEVPWYETYLGHQGVIGRSTGSWCLQFDIPNYPQPGVEKWIWIQITSLLKWPDDYQVIWDGGYGEDDSPPMMACIDPGDNWFTTVFWITIPENPSQETVELWFHDPGGYVDQVVIDTLCVGSSPPECPWDCEDVPDGQVGIDDLVALIGHWGPCPAPPAECPWDCEAVPDGDVGINDLVALIGHWGPCP